MAVLVKTPGLSAIKTRLAATIGSTLAREFYELALSATAALALKLQEEGELQIYWAVAEKDGLRDRRWQNLLTIYQGSGSLGERLSRVYDELLSQHKYVCFIGADSPHLLLKDLQEAILKTRTNSNFIIGPTADGGFYFFGGKTPIPRATWLDVSYSTSQTAAQLIENLKIISDVHLTEKNFDIDTKDDLTRYLDMAEASDLLPEQVNLIRWVKKIEKSLMMRC